MAALAQVPGESQISGFDFWLKVLGIYLAFSAVVIYSLVQRRRLGDRFFIGPQQMEGELVATGEVSLHDLQAGPWRVNSQKATTFAGFSLGALIAAVVFMFSQEMKSYDLLSFQILIFVYGLSAMGYFISMQFWFLALDLGGSPMTRLRYRRHATSFQTLGWYAMQVAAGIAVMIVSTLLGWVFAACGAAGFVWVYHVKYRLTEYQR